VWYVDFSVSSVEAVSDGSVYNGKPLTMAWQSADGILSPKIIVPQPSLTSQTRTSLSTSKSQTSSSSSSNSAATTDEPRSHTTSFSKLLEVSLHFLIGSQPSDHYFRSVCLLLHFLIATVLWCGDISAMTLLVWRQEQQLPVKT